MTEAASTVYVPAEARARAEIDAQLVAAGWLVQSANAVNLVAGRGVAVREFVLRAPHGRADYLLFVEGKAVGVLEAKPEGTILSNVEPQRDDYAEGMPDYLEVPIEPLPFTYMSTGRETRFKNGLDPDARTRDVFAVHRPETLAGWVDTYYTRPLAPTLRHGLKQLPELDTTGLWPAQIEAIRNLERSLAENRPRALIQMATGSGKTYTAANIAYRLIRHADAQRILFLVDRANLGRQTLKEFQAFEVPGTGHRFTELYNVQHLSSNRLDPIARVTISTIQRLFSTLKGEPALDEELDEESAYEALPDEPVSVAYNPQVPPETFDVVIVDECHRSIFGLWRQVLDYFDAFTIGLTATPNKQAFGFFKQNLVMEYGHEGGDTAREDLTVVRDDFWASTSNKQLNFVQHVKTLLTPGGRAAIVVPDNVLFEGGAGETVRRKLLHECDVHTLLRLPTGIFYAQGVKANVLFFDRKPASETPWTKELWIYDFRTNKQFTLKQNLLRREHLADFVAVFKPTARHEREESERFKRFSYEDLLARDKVSLDITWLRDDSLEDMDNLPPPEVIAQEIVEDLEAALAEFAATAQSLQKPAAGA